MKKRFTFRCWNCNKTYTLFCEIKKGQVVIVACPYCDAEGVVDLEPYPKRKTQVLRSLSVTTDETDEQDIGEELELPDILPTQKPE